MLSVNLSMSSTKGMLHNTGSHVNIALALITAAETVTVTAGQREQASVDAATCTE